MYSCIFKVSLDLMFLRLVLLERAWAGWIQDELHCMGLGQVSLACSSWVVMVFVGLVVFCGASWVGPS